VLTVGNRSKWNGVGDLIAKKKKKSFRRTLHSHATLSMSGAQRRDSITSQWQRESLSLPVQITRDAFAGDFR